MPWSRYGALAFWYVDDSLVCDSGYDCLCFCVCVNEEMTSLSNVVDQLRCRVKDAVSRSVTDAEALKIGVAASCSNANCVIEYVVDRQLGKELRSVKMHDVAMTLDEFKILCAQLQSTRTSPTKDVLKDCVFSMFVENVTTHLKCTITERDQQLAWSIPATRVLTYVAIHAELDTEERVGCALGGVVGADMRRLEDLRASLEGDQMDVVSVGAAICGLVDCIMP